MHERLRPAPRLSSARTCKKPLATSTALILIKMDLGSLKMAVSLDFLDFSKRFENGFQLLRQHQAFRHLQMSTISTPTGDRPPVNISGWPRPQGPH